MISVSKFIDNLFINKNVFPYEHPCAVSIGKCLNCLKSSGRERRELFCAIHPSLQDAINRRLYASERISRYLLCTKSTSTN